MAVVGNFYLIKELFSNLFLPRILSVSSTIFDDKNCVIYFIRDCYRFDELKNTIIFFFSEIAAYEFVDSELVLAMM